MMAVSLSSCNDAESSPDGPDVDSSLSLSFTIENGEKNSRVSYDGLKSSFDNGDLIGCIIASHEGANYNYLANACWEYNASDNFLYLKKLFDPENKLIDINDDTENTIIRHDKIKGAPYLSLLNSEIEYTFFFYYPYVDQEILSDAITTILKVENGQSIVDFNLFDFPNLRYGAPYNQDKVTIYTANADAAKAQFVKILNDNSMLTKPISKNANGGTETELSTAGWLNYPIAVMKNQDRTDNPNLRLNHSDFMYAKIESVRNRPITSAATKCTVPVELVKQMATIEIEFDADIQEPTDVHLKGREIDNGWGGKTQKRLHTGKEFDFVNGTLKSYKIDNIYSVTLFEQAVLTDDKLYPANIGNGYKYRIILPPMSTDEFLCDLKFTVNSSEKTIHLNDNPRLNHIDGNTFYLVKVTKMPDDSWDIVINDWRPGGSQDLIRPDW